MLTCSRLLFLLLWTPTQFGICSALVKNLLSWLRALLDALFVQVIRRIREETGAKVKLQDAVEDCEWRVVTLTSSEDALSPFCGAQEALLRCFYCTSEDQVPTYSLCDQQSLCCPWTCM